MIVTSPDLATLDFAVLFDLSGVTPAITLTNLSTGSGLANCHWWYEIKTPSNTYIHQGTSLALDMSGVWTPVTVPTSGGQWPQPFGQVEWSGVPYVTTLYVKDSDGTIFSCPKGTVISRPRNLKTSALGNFGEASIRMDVRCEKAKLYVEDTTPYSYNGITGTPAARKYTLVYPPDETDTIPTPYVLENFSAALLPISFSSPGYQIIYSSSLQYDYANGTSVILKYKFRKEFAVACDIDLCPLICDFNDLVTQAQSSDCSNAGELNFKIQQITALLTQAIIGKMQPLCGIDVAEKVAKIKEIGGFTCNCSLTGAGIPTGVNSGGDLTIVIDETCGDIIASGAVSGSNIHLVIKDVKYIFKICDDSDLLNAFEIEETYDAGSCTKTYCLKVTAANLPGGCCPEYVDVVIKGTVDPPSECPANPFPKELWTPDGLTSLGVASDVNDMIAKMMANTGGSGWAHYGKWVAAGFCEAVLFRATGIAGNIPKIPVSVVNTAPGGCVGNKQTYLITPTAYCGGAPVTGLSYPLDVYVRYTSGGAKTHLYVITNYTNFLAQLNAAPGKPVNISYVADPGGSQLSVLVVDNDCAANKHVYLEADVMDDIFYGAAHNGSPATIAVAGLVSGVTIIDSRNNTQLLSFVCTTKNERAPWHTVRVGDFIYTVETDTGKLFKINVSSPMFPVVVSTHILPQPAGVAHAAFSGLLQYGGTINSHWDVYFPTDLNSQVNGVLYMVEGSSGSIWKYDIATDTITASEFDAKLYGKCPRFIIGNNLYLTQDGGREALMGVTSGLNPKNLQILDLTSVGTGTLVFSTLTIGSDGDEVWAASLEPATGYFWCTMVNGTLVYKDPISLAQTTYANNWNIVGNFTGLVNTHIFGGKIYMSNSTTNGTRYVDISVGLGSIVPATSFDTIIDGVGVIYPGHYNFIVPPGKCYGIVTVDKGSGAGKRGAVAKCTLTGQFLNLIEHTTAGNIYNLVPVTGIASVTPNNLCT